MSALLDLLAGLARLCQSQGQLLRLWAKTDLRRARSRLGRHVVRSRPISSKPVSGQPVNSDRSLDTRAFVGTNPTDQPITVAVGTIITDRPPHRSVRARLR